jgi:RimJ/RimL family protein N-acetyltransferase
VSAVSRLLGSIRRRGVKTTARLVARDARFDSSHIWYELPIGSERPHLPLSPPLKLVRADRSQLPALVWAIDPDEAVGRLEAGEGLWLVLDGETPAFSCWILRVRMKFAGRRLTFPDDTVCLEEIMTSPAYRGRGIAPAAMAAIADRLEADEPDVARVVTPVDERNTPSRRAMEKAGFRRLAVVTQRRRGPWRRIVVTSPAESAAIDFLRSIPSL